MVTLPKSAMTYIVGPSGQLLAGPARKWSLGQSRVDADFTVDTVRDWDHVLVGTSDGQTVVLSDISGDPDVPPDAWGAYVDPEGRAIRDMDGGWVVGDQGLLLEWPCKFWIEREPPETGGLIPVAALRAQPTVLTASGVASEWVPIAAVDGAELLRGSLGVGHAGRLFDLADEMGSSMTSIGANAHRMDVSQDHRAWWLA